jgi:putative transposase
VPKDRRGGITARVFSVLRKSWESVGRDFEGELREGGYASDPVHLLVSYPPKVALSTRVHSLQGVRARRIRAAELPDVRSKLWGSHFWSPRSCAVSCGEAPLETLRPYVEKQQGRAASSQP